MNRRGWILIGLFAFLGLSYAVFFTEWLRPAPIEIASQVRFSVQPPRFTRPVAKPVAPGQPPQPPQTNRLKRVDLIERVGRPAKGVIDQAPGGVANVTFSLDALYELTRLRVEDVPADGSRPHVFWQLKGKSRPLNSLLYGRNPEGMVPILAGSIAEPLQAGAPYRLIIEAGRRRGTHAFTTVAAQPGG